MGGLLSLFFAFLRAGEMTTPDEGGYGPAEYLSYADIALYIAINENRHS